DLDCTALAGPFDGGGQQPATDTAAALVGAHDEIVDLHDLVDAALRTRHDPRDQHRHAQHTKLALRDQKRHGGVRQPRHHLLTRMLWVIEQVAERIRVSRTCQPHANRGRRHGFYLGINDRHLILRLRPRRGPEALSRNTEAAGKRRLRQVTTLRAAYFGDVKYQPFWSRFVIIHIL